MQGSWTGHWPNEAATTQFAHAVAHAARAGDCLALVGDMAAGKTTLTRAIAEALCIDVRSQFSSPTYTYVNEYAGSRLTMVHIDLYRLNDQQGARALGLDDTLMRRDALLVVEWADRLVEMLPADALWLRLQADGPEAEHRRWSAVGPRAVGERLLGPPDDGR